MHQLALYADEPHSCSLVPAPKSYEPQQTKARQH